MNEFQRTRPRMSEPAERICDTRVLCLGNELIPNDSLGCIVAERIRTLVPDGVEVVSTSESGFHLLDYLLNASSLIVVDTLLTGGAPPGTICEVPASDLDCVPGGSLHGVGLFDALALARELRLPAAKQVSIVGVESVDCDIVGGAMHPAIIETVLAVARILIERLWARTNNVSNERKNPRFLC